MGRAESGKVSRKALKIGSIVDGYCEQDWRSGKYHMKKSDPPEVTSCMTAWEKWKRDYPTRFKRIVSMQDTQFYDDWGVACTPDIEEYDGYTDIKTSGRVNINYWVQIAVQNRNKKLLHKRVLRLDKNLGEYEYVGCPEMYSQEYLETVFVGMLNVFNFYKSEEKL